MRPERGYAAMRQNAKYKQIETYILGKISSGELSPGDQIETEKQNAIRDIRSQVVELSVQIAEKILRENLSTDAKQMDLVNRLLDEVSSDDKKE